jgi:ankyrin repeat protein
LAPVATDNAFALYSCRVGDFKKFYEQLRANPLLISARDAEGHSALHWFALNNNKEAVKKLLSLGAEVSVVACARVQGRVSPRVCNGCACTCTCMCVARDPQVDARAANLQTPLMWAAIRGHIELCLLLLENGANHDARDSLGATPLILSVQHSQPLMFLFLLNRGCKVDVGDIRGATVVHWTAYKGSQRCVCVVSSSSPPSVGVCAGAVWLQARWKSRAFSIDTALTCRPSTGRA